MNNESLKTLLDDHIGQIFATPDQIDVMASAVAKQISEKIRQQIHCLSV